MGEGILQHLPVEHPQSIEAIEAVMGIPLFPEGFDMSKALAHETEERCEIHIKACDLALSAIAHITGKFIDQGDTLSSSDSQRVAKSDDIRLLRSLVAIANNVYEAEHRNEPPPKGADAPSTPRASEQAALTRQISSHLQTLPRELSYSGSAPLREQFEDTMVGIAPSGSGKSAIEGVLLRHAGVGKPDGGGRVLRAIIATTEVTLVDELTGKRGDGTFRRFLGEDVDITPFYGKVKNKKGKAVATTGRSLLKLDPEEFDIAVIDEGHQALGPQLLEYVKKIGIRCLLFTATPKYARHNDLRYHFRSVERGTILSYIAKGILNRTRLLTFTYEKNPLGMAAGIASRYVKAGRKVVVYCPRGTEEQPGGPSRLVASLINKLLGEEVAAHIGSHRPQKEKEEVLAAFDSGQIKVVTTSRMLREGSNIRGLSVGILIGPNFSLLDMGQKAGRPMRLGEYVSELVELVPRARPKKPMVSLWQLFGLEHVRSGEVIGPARAAQFEKNIMSSEAEDDSTLETALYETIPEATEEAEVFKLDLLPEDIQAAMVANKPVRLVTVGETMPPPEGYIQSSVAAAERGLPRKFLHYLLDKEGYRYEGIWEPAEDGWQHERWYEPAASKALEDLPDKISHLELQAREAADICGIHKGLFLRIAGDMNIKPQPRLSNKHRRSLAYNFEQILIVSEAIDAIPVAEETDVPVIHLQTEINSTAIPTNVGTFMRRNPVHGIQGWCHHVSAQEAARLRAAHYGIPVADENHKPIPVLAKMAGVSLGTFRSKMTAAEKASVKPLRRSQNAGPTEHLSLEIARPIIERIAPEKLPPHLITIEFIEQVIPRAKTTIAARLRYQNPSPTKLFLNRPRTGPSVGVFGWKDLQKLEERYGRRPGVEPIPYDDLAQDEADHDPEKWQLSQAVQKRYIDKDMLVPPPDSELKAEAEKAVPGPKTEVKAEVVREPTATLFLASSDKREATNIKPPVPSTESSPPPASTTRKPRAPLPPAYTIKLHDYLRATDSLCSPSTAKLLARRGNLPVPLEDAAGAWWATKATAEGIKRMVQAFPKAERGMKPASEIAKDYQGYGVDARHVMHLAGLLTTSLDTFVQNRRVRLPDGRPGELRMHYNQMLTKRLEQELDAIVRDELRLHRLVRFSKSKP